jgi:hypothetical protein
LSTQICTPPRDTDGFSDTMNKVVLSYVKFVENRFKGYVDTLRLEVDLYIQTSKRNGRIHVMRDVGKSFAELALMNKPLFSSVLDYKLEFMQGVSDVVYKMLRNGISNNDIRLANICLLGGEQPKFTIVDWDLASETDAEILFGNGSDARYPGYGTSYHHLHCAAQLVLCVFFVWNIVYKQGSLPELEPFVAKTSVTNWWQPPSVENTGVSRDFADFMKKFPQDSKVYQVVQACWRPKGVITDNAEEIDSALQEISYWNDSMDDLLSTAKTGAL